MHDGRPDVTVLIIEDDREVADMYSLRLVADGYVVKLARDGREGLRVATEQIPDFIYLDLRLPGLDGFEVLDGLRRCGATRDIPVIILSNVGDPELRARGLNAGARGFRLKADTTPNELSSAVWRSTRAGVHAIR